jgi:hypothetical protein
VSGVLSSCRHETSKSRLGRLPLAEGRLDSGQHHVERAAEPADLGAVIGLFDALAQVAGGNRARRLGHLFQRTQSDPDREPRRGRKRNQDGAAHEQLQFQEAVSGARDPVERDRHDEEPAEAALPMNECLHVLGKQAELRA